MVPPWRLVTAGPHMPPDPLNHGVPPNAPVRKLEHQAFLGFRRRVELVAIEHEKDFHRRMANALIAVDKGVVTDQEKTKGSNLGRQIWVEFLATKAHARLSNGGLQRPGVAQAAGTTPTL